MTKQQQPIYRLILNTACRKVNSQKSTSPQLEYESQRVNDFSMWVWDGKAQREIRKSEVKPLTRQVSSFMNLSLPSFTGKAPKTKQNKQTKKQNPKKPQEMRKKTFSEL